MTPFLMLAQAPIEQHQGWLTIRLLGVLTGNAEWVLWLLAGLSVVSDGARAAFAWTSDGRAWRIAPPTVRVRNAIGAREGWYSVVGVDEGGARVAAHAVDVEDSSEGTATLVHGGLHGLELVSEDDGATR